MLDAGRWFKVFSGFAKLSAVSAVVLLAAPAAPAASPAAPAAAPAAPAAAPADRVPDQSGRINPSLAVVDIVTSRGGTVDSTRVDCYYRLSNELFSFVRSGDRYAARFELSLIVIDDDDYQVTAETIRDSVLVDTEVEMRVMDHSRAKLYTTYLPPGEYDLEIKLYDQDTGSQHDMARPFEVPDYYKDRLSVSDIQFAGLVLEGSSNVGLERRGIRIVPNLTRAFGEDHTDMYIYYEVYSDAAGEAQQPLSVVYRIKSPSGKVMLDREESLERQGHIGAYSGRFDTSDLPQGIYTLEIEVDDRAVRNRAKATSEFHITWQFLLPLTTARNFREITEQLRYIAKNDELDTLKKYRDAPAGEQKVALEAFWKRRDPTPDTDRNEHMITYYRRIAYANEHFDDGLRKGWRSDQGRVYIVYGPPDEVERHTWDRSYSHPYLVWHYNNISRSFVFVDFDGYGRYQLYRVY